MAVIKKGDTITLAQADATYEVLELGLMYPDRNTYEKLSMQGKLAILLPA